MDVRLLIDGRVVWVKKSCTWEVGKVAEEKKKEANMERKTGRME